jgi:hypothetical protein
VRPQTRREPSRDDLILIATGAAIALAAIAGSIAGAGGFETYPRIEVDMDAVTFALCAALLVLAPVPFAIRRWRSRG